MLAPFTRLPGVPYFSAVSKQFLWMANTEQRCWVGHGFSRAARANKHEGFSPRGAGHCSFSSYTTKLLECRSKETVVK